MRYISLSGFLLFISSFVAMTCAQAEKAGLPVKVPTSKNPAQMQPANKSPDKSPLVFNSLEQMDELAALGMPALALHLLSQEQQRWPLYSPDWYVFERKRIGLLSAVEDWQAYVTHNTLFDLLSKTKKVAPLRATFFCLG